MGKWLALLESEMPQTPSSATDKADERGVLSVLAVTHEEVSEESLPLETDDDHHHVVVQRCADCLHLTRAGTCAEPIAAGLLTGGEGFGIVSPPAAHAASCAAFSARAPSKPLARPYRLTPAQGNAAHPQAWDDAAIARFQARVQRLARLGYDADDADDLAEAMHLRDVQTDYRHLCLECSHYRPGRCGNHQRAGLHAPDLGRDLAGLLQRCPGFAPMATSPRAAPPGHDTSALDGQLRRPMTHHRLAHRSGITEDTAT